MEFNINHNLPLNFIRATEIKEEEMLKSNLLKTKLSYELVDSLVEKQGELVEGEIFNYSNQLKITIPNLIEDPRRAAYYLRMVLDSNAVKNNFLPLHAAALKNNGLVQLIFGATGKGKSLTLSRILSHNSDIHPIGDDHIIIGKGFLSGNQVLRTRYGEKESYLPLKNKTLTSFEKYEMILIDVHGENTSKELNPLEVSENPKIEQAVLKYLISNPLEKRSQDLYQKLIARGILKKYRDSFNKLVMGAERIRELSGNENYLLETFPK